MHPPFIQVNLTHIILSKFFTKELKSFLFLRYREDHRFPQPDDIGAEERNQMLQLLLYAINLITHPDHIFGYLNTFSTSTLKELYLFLG